MAPARDRRPPARAPGRPRRQPPVTPRRPRLAHPPHGPYAVGVGTGAEPTKGVAPLLEVADDAIGDPRDRLDVVVGDSLAPGLLYVALAAVYAPLPLQPMEASFAIAMAGAAGLVIGRAAVGAFVLDRRPGIVAPLVNVFWAAYTMCALSAIVRAAVWRPPPGWHPLPPARREARGWDGTSRDRPEAHAGSCSASPAG